MDYEDHMFSKLKGTFRHYCSDWDGLAIDETCVEFEHCLCELEGKPVRASKTVEDKPTGARSMTRSEASEHIRNAAEAKQAEVYYAHRDALLAHDTEQRAEIERLKNELSARTNLEGSAPCWNSAHIKQITRLREALAELYALVKGECPRLLNEDAGGDAQLDMKIEQALKEHHEHL